MVKLILLYWGSVFLLYLSQEYYPTVPTPGRHFSRAQSDLFLVAAIFWLSAFSFLRTSYNDTTNYIRDWQTAPSTIEFLRSGGLKDWTNDPLSYLWQSVAHDLSGSYHVYFLLPAVLSNFAVVKLLKCYSVNPALGLLIYFSMGTYIMYMAAMKQCFALFFLLMSIPYALDRKYFRFYILVAVATLFHTYAFLFAIVPLMTGKPWGKRTWLTLGGTLFLLLTYERSFRLLIDTIPLLDELISEEELFDGHRINILRVAVYWVGPVLALVFYNRLFQDSRREDNLFVNLSIFSAMILTLGLGQGANLFARMAAYFETATAISLPWMIKKLFNRPSIRLVTNWAIGLYFVYFLYEFVVSKGFGDGYRSISLFQFFAELLSVG